MGGQKAKIDHEPGDGKEWKPQHIIMGGRAGDEMTKTTDRNSGQTMVGVPRREDKGLRAASLLPAEAQQHCQAEGEGRPAHLRGELRHHASIGAEQDRGRTFILVGS